MNSDISIVYKSEDYVCIENVVCNISYTGKNYNVFILNSIIFTHPQLVLTQDSVIIIRQFARAALLPFVNYAKYGCRDLEALVIYHFM